MKFKTPPTCPDCKSPNMVRAFKYTTSSSVEVESRGWRCPRCGFYVPDDNSDKSKEVIHFIGPYPNEITCGEDIESVISTFEFEEVTCTECIRIVSEIRKSLEDCESIIEE